MKYPLQLIAAAAALSLSFTTRAQTVSDFENIILPGPDTSYLETQVVNGDGIYTFNSGNATFYGNISWGFWGEFNCSNGTDTITPGFENMRSCIAGSGFDNSSNYGIAYVTTDFMGPDPTATIPVGAKLTGAADGAIVAGVYVTNSTYAYRYILENYPAGQYWFQLVVRGYNNGIPSADSVVMTMADYSDTANPYVLNTWEWLSLSTLGEVDSITFDLQSNDVNEGGIVTPAYFAIDNLTTLDGTCPGIAELTISNVTDNSAGIAWVNSSSANVAWEYEIAVDNSATLAPTVAVTTQQATAYNAIDLNTSTTYYVHIRTKCAEDSYAAWDTASFTTQDAVSVDNINRGVQISVSPNPALNVISINTANAAVFDIFNIEGKKVLETNQKTNIDISTLPEGMYIIRATDENKGSGIARFIKTR